MQDETYTCLPAAVTNRIMIPEAGNCRYGFIENKNFTCSSNRNSVNDVNSTSALSKRGSSGPGSLEDVYEA